MAKQKGFGPAWLVVLRTNLDELPIGLYSSEQTAVQRADRVSVADANKAADFMGVDRAGVVNVAVITFDARGRPVDLRLIRDLAARRPKKRA